MVIIRDGKKYYTLEESIKILDKFIEEDAREFAKEVLRRQKVLKIKEKAYA